MISVAVGAALHFISPAFAAPKSPGITLSREQLAFARERASEAGQSNAIEFRLQDYREIDERFDKIVSVGMFEHVGPEF